MTCENLIRLLTQAFERAADRLRAKDHGDPWPDDLWARDVVRLLGEASREVIARISAEDEERDAVEGRSRPL